MQGANEQALARDNRVKEITPQVIKYICRIIVVLSHNLIAESVIYTCYCNIYVLFLLTSRKSSGIN
jgi:hypothetical protein